jgi:hypothetical protein
MRMTIYIPPDLAAKMKLNPHVNWSKLAQRAFVDELSYLASVEQSLGPYVKPKAKTK